MNYLKHILWLLCFLCLLSAPHAGQLGNWQYTNNLNVARFDNVAVLSRSTIIYTFGGFAYSTTPYPVERATIRPDGLAFSTTAERAQINPNGTLGEWTTISILPHGFVRSSLIYTSPYVYIIGNYSATSDIYRTSVNPDGSLGPWVMVSSKLNLARSDQMTILINSTLYVVDGLGAGSFQTINIEKATIFPDGEFSVFTTISYTIASHIDGSLFYDGTYLNVIGGWYAGNYSYRSERTKIINGDTSLGIWEPASQLESERYLLGYVQTSTYAYTIGGYGGQNSVEYAPILPPAGIDKITWQLFDNP